MAPGKRPLSSMTPTFRGGRARRAGARARRAARASSPWCCSASSSTWTARSSTSSAWSARRAFTTSICPTASLYEPAPYAMPRNGWQALQGHGTHGGGRAAAAGATCRPCSWTSASGESSAYNDPRGKAGDAVLSALVSCRYVAAARELAIRRARVRPTAGRPTSEFRPAAGFTDVDSC